MVPQEQVKPKIEPEKNPMGIITIDQNVLQALDFFTHNPPPLIDINKFRSPFVVGSGNAFNTGVVLFSGTNAVLADESNFRNIIENAERHLQDGSPKDAVIISASGGKDSVWEVELAKKHGLITALFTTKANSPAAKIADQVVVFQSINEPYTYNVSTYMGMILGATHEDPKLIKNFLDNLELPPGFNEHSAFTFVLPDRFGPICPMIDIKQRELFGPLVPLTAFPQGHARHAKFVIRTPQELVISLGQKNEFYGDPDHRWDITLPPNSNFASIMALTYFIVGKIQTAKPPYYMKNIQNYVSDYGPKAYSPNTKPFDVIVPGSE